MAARAQVRPHQAPTAPIADDLADLRAHTVRVFAGATAACAGAILASAAVVVPRDDIPAMTVAAVLLAAAASSYLLLARHVSGAAATLLAGLLAAEAVAQAAFSDNLLACADCLVVLAAVYLLGARGGLVVALAASALIVASSPPPSVARAAVTLAWAAAVVAWLGTHAFHTVVSWVLDGAREAHARAEEARARQADLARLTRDLRHAYDQLQGANEELERARAAANEARRRKVEFATTVSHELRTPLNLIIGFSEMMVLTPHKYGGEVLPDGYRGDIETIYRNACHLSNLIDDILDLSQVDARRMPLQLEPLRIAEVIGEATTAVGSLFADKGVRLAVAPAPGLPALIADRTRVRQVLINLLANAARFTERGDVTVSATAADGGVRVSVADTGTGMPPDEAEAVFSEFHRAGGRLQLHTSGLGLAICKRLVELHGGRIWLETRLGAGTTFTFSLPLAATPASGAAAWETWATAAPGPRRRTLAVVTRDPEVARLLPRYLDRYGVAPAGSVAGARAAIRRKRAHALLVTDPADYAAATDPPAAARPSPDVPVLCCPFSSSHERRHTLGIAAYLAKPVTRERLRGALSALGTGPRTVLVADDHPDMVRLLARMLRAELPGCTVWAADGGRAALAVAASRRPDAILLDLLMPDVDGYAVIERLRGDPDLRSIPIIVISAKGTEGDAVSAGELRIARRGGLSVSDVIRCAQASLDLLLEDPPPGSDPAPGSESGA